MKCLLTPWLKSQTFLFRNEWRTEGLFSRWRWSGAGIRTWRRCDCFGREGSFRVSSVIIFVICLCYRCLLLDSARMLSLFIAGVGNVYCRPFTCLIVCVYATFSIEPNIDNLVQNIQHKPSHCLNIHMCICYAILFSIVLVIFLYKLKIWINIYLAYGPSCKHYIFLSGPCGKKNARPWFIAFPPPLF